MKQIWPTYAYSPITNVLTLTGLNIDRDQLLLVTAADRGRIMYNFADSSVTASAFTSGVNTALTLVATTAGLTTTAALIIYFDDQATSSTVTGTVELGPTSLNALESITVTMGQVTVTGGLTDVQLRASAVTIGGTVTVGNGLTISSLPEISGSVAVSNISSQLDAGDNPVVRAFAYGYDYDLSVPSAVESKNNRLGVFGNVTVETGVTLGAGVSRIGVVTIGGGTVTIGAGTAQIGSVTASGTVTIGNNITLLGNQSSGLVASVLDGAGIPVYFRTSDENPAGGNFPISGTVTANTFALQGTAVTTSNFTSTTASTVLASFNSTREVLTIFNEGPGNLHVCVGATCTTVQYQVRLSSGDYYEAPNHQTTITHSAVFATAGTARVTEVS